MVGVFSYPGMTQTFEGVNSKKARSEAAEYPNILQDIAVAMTGALLSLKHIARA